MHVNYPNKSQPGVHHARKPAGDISDSIRLKINLKPAIIRIGIACDSEASGVTKLKQYVNKINYYSHNYHFAATLYKLVHDD